MEHLLCARPYASTEDRKVNKTTKSLTFWILHSTGDLNTELFQDKIISMIKKRTEIGIVEERL